MSTFKIALVSPYQSSQISSDSILTINVNQLEQIKRSTILNYLVQHSKIEKDHQYCNLITHTPRNYYIDLLLTKDYELIYQEETAEEEQQIKHKKLVKLPQVLEMITRDTENMIDSQRSYISIKNFNVLEKIGEGTFAQIYLVQKIQDRKLYCMKRINKAECRINGNLSMIKNEFQILQLSSRWKIKLYFRFEDAKYVYFIVDYCPFGDLYTIIKQNRKAEEFDKLTTSDKYVIWIQIAFGIVSMHERGLVYRDLKPENILINEFGEVKICDFGFACKVDPDKKLTELCGSYEYLAPEMIKREGYGKPLDLYCLGLLFYELIVGYNPYEGITPENINEIKNKPINYQKKALTPIARDLIKKLLKQKPEDRLGYRSSLDIFKHQFFQENQDLVLSIINKKSHILKSLRFKMPTKMKERTEVDEKESYIFSKNVCYNYLTPNFDVTQNVGPKFSFSN